jgi:hypothetical protein
MPVTRTRRTPRDAVRPVTLTLNPRQLAWLDTQRQHGSISRSAALRQAIDRLIAIEAQQALTAQPAQTANG